MADYFRHWLDMGNKFKKPPKIFHVNWFRQDIQGNFLWPGFGDNLRVIEWILERCEGTADAERTPIGWVPKLDTLDMTGLDLGQDTMKALLSVDAEEWKRELADIEDFFKQFGARLPGELWQEYEALKERLGV